MVSYLCRNMIRQTLTHVTHGVRVCSCSQGGSNLLLLMNIRGNSSYRFPSFTAAVPPITTRPFHFSSCLLAGGVSTVNMPPLTPTMRAGGIVEWLKNEGDPIAPGDVLCKIQTDIAVISLLAIDEGILAKILRPEKSTEVVVGAPLALVVDLGEDWQNVVIPEETEPDPNADELPLKPLLDISMITSQSTNVSVRLPPTHRAAVRKPRNRRGKSMERNFITPLRAMTDYLLKQDDMVGLRKTMRRSPHADEPPITVYWRRDVETRSVKIWGSLDLMHAERVKREQETDDYNEALFNMKRILKNYRAQSQLIGETTGRGHSSKDFESLFSGSGKIVLTAVAINFSNFVIKLLAWWMTGSHSLFAESIHSLADTVNQIILAYGIHKSNQRANVEHPYGYTHMRNVASLISGVGIFCLGAGLSIYHGIMGLISAEHMESLYWAFYILAGSFVSEGATLILAWTAVRKRAKAAKMTPMEFIKRSLDPALNVVILEDTAAVLGVAIAATCMGLTTLYGNPIPDAMGSLFIGGLLGVVASFIIYSNSAALVGRSIPRDKLDRISASLESDIMVRAIHDVKGIDMGNSKIRYKAEVDFDGRELAKIYLDRHDVRRMMMEVKSLTTTEDFESFFLHHGEGIVDSLGAEIDRIENKLMGSHPEIRHCDLEIL